MLADRRKVHDPEARGEQEAWRRLFALWGAAWSPGEGEDPCALAGTQRSRLPQGEGGVDGILSRGRPAMVRLHDEEGPAWLAVEGYRDGQVVVAAGSAQRVVDVAALAGQAVDGYVVLWKPGSGAAPGKADVVHP